MVDLAQGLLKFQNLMLEVSPALVPLFSMVYSLLVSLHCSIMCGPLLPVGSDRNQYLLYRMMSYTLMGALFGYFGKLVRQSLEFEVLSLFGFLAFAFITLMLAGWDLLPQNLKGKLSRLPKPKNGALRGILSALIPCHTLFFFYSLAVVTQGAWGGALVLLGHAVSSVPAIAYGRHFLEKMGKKLVFGKFVFRILLVGLALINLVYFAARLFVTDDQARSKIFFCL